MKGDNDLMKIKIKMDKKVLAEVPAAYALAGGAAGLIFAPKITLAGIALAAAAGLRPAVEVPPIDAPKPEGFPWLNPAPDVKDAPVAELKETKPAAKKAATKAAPAKKPAAKKSTTASKSTAAKKTTSTKAAPAKKATASKSTTAKKSTATKAAPAKKSTASKSTTAKKTTTKKTTAKK